MKKERKRQKTNEKKERKRRRTTQKRGVSIRNFHFSVECLRHRVFATLLLAVFFLFIFIVFDFVKNNKNK